MAIYCGNDIIKISRIKDSIERIGENFIKRVYTEEEIRYCESRRMCKFQSYAVRFAAKEAVYKALAPTEGLSSWLDVEVRRLENGKPKAHLKGALAEYAKSHGICDENIEISLSHDEDYAIATAIIEY